MDPIHLENEELIIQTLEELDSTYSKIRNNLRTMKMKIATIEAGSRRMLGDCAPWINFFEINPKPETSPLSELHLNSLKFKECTESPDVMSISVPKNPFMDLNSSELLNKSIIKGYKSLITSDSSNSIAINKSRYETYESTVHAESEETGSCLFSFDESQIPQIFQQEQHLKALYRFIQERRTVSLEDICRKFEELETDKLKIFISLLCRKNFIRQNGDNLTIEK